MLDDHDLRILRVIQRDADININDLASEVNLSRTPCWRRLKKLEEQGVIQKKVAILDHKKLGFSVHAYVQVSIKDHELPALSRFLTFIEDCPLVMECNAIAGNYDYVLKVMAKDTEQLEDFLMRQLLGLGVVQSANTNFILRQKKNSTALPI